MNFTLTVCPPVVFVRSTHNPEVTFTLNQHGRCRCAFRGASQRPPTKRRLHPQPPERSSTPDSFRRPAMDHPPNASSTHTSSRQKTVCRARTPPRPAHLPSTYG